MAQKSKTGFKRFKLRHPSIRDDLLQVFHQLTDVKMQQEDWVGREALPRTESNRLSALLRFVYISVSLAKEPGLTIGFFLKDDNEAHSVWSVLDAVEQIFQTAGVDATCETYVACAEWSNLVQSVDHALYIMQDKHESSQLMRSSKTSSKS
jgi:hypothetical protein